ncbi:peptide deformylase, mitochondrial-like [Diorhabda carinulata]|uniref:peptide deformylase, mitochondrial-like n=1 Tax=Diorhabda sublineata TaxID=1163346 RepID=UPI0024E18F5D|nr:peptide deformylase, mitochondrial-like [Diorhabda sublineata]XP_057672144.1 peptide deformylase, mitochondrial-like [Diorhabda carinulata]
MQQNVRYISYKALRTWYAKLVKPRPGDPPYKHVVQIGDPNLRIESERISEDEILTPEVQYLIKQLKHVSKTYNCVGLSAPQIGMPLQIIIAEFNKKHLKHYSEQEIINKEITLQPQTVIINPLLRVADYSKVTFSESCESIKGYYADVARYRSIEVKGWNEEGNFFSILAHGWWARILQHEIDHLQGKMYTDIMDPKTLTCCCWHEVNERAGRVHIPLGNK